MKKTFLSLIFCAFAVASAQAFTVTLKVIDQTAGTITNNVNDNNETNIYCWVSDALSTQNPRTPSDWWYPMYNAGGVSPTGLLVKNTTSWEWTITLQATAGSYEWCPGAKTLGWNTITPNMYGYIGDSGNNLIFTVAADGTVTGHTELVIPDPSASTETFPVTLKVIDYTAGALTDAPGTWAYDANIITWVTPILNDGGYWFYGMFDRTVNWDGGSNLVTFPRGLLVKEADKWTWQVTFDAAAGVYQWNPMSILHGYASLNGYGGAYWEGTNMQFSVGADGTISGQNIIELGAPVVFPQDKIRVAAIGDSNTAGAGASNAGQYAWSVQLGNLLGDDYFTYNFGVSGATLMNFPEPWGAWTNNKDNAYAIYQTYDANIILIALGTNDSKTDYWNNGHDFKAEYEAFITNVKSFAAENAEVYMILPIHAINTNFDIQPTNIDNGVVPAINQLSLEKGINVIDWHSATSAWTTAQLPDGIHANDAALAVMAQKVNDIITTAKPVITNIDGALSVTGTYAEVRWYKDGVLISGEPTEAGTYKAAVKLNANTDDILVSEPISLSPTGIKNIENENFNVFPTVTSDFITVIKNSNSAIKIIDIAGKTVLETSENRINISNLSSGIYFVKSENNIEKIVKK
ncbi:MAG: GDSL-type esterase/lipase family protein [Prevotellaceae bacterium]|jgi:lysophospholipase L1-like esterase|nr:GDSL-type esterase/lipase family protein [Prevotellaceae bacterium]